jgi:hypothetical protein
MLVEHVKRMMVVRVGTPEMKSLEFELGIRIVFGKITLGIWKEYQHSAWKSKLSLLTQLASEASKPLCDSPFFTSSF